MGRVLPREHPASLPDAFSMSIFVSELEASRERKIWKITEEEVRSLFCVVGPVVLELFEAVSTVSVSLLLSSMLLLRTSGNCLWYCC